MKSKNFFSLLTAFGLAGAMVLCGGCSDSDDEVAGTTPVTPVTPADDSTDDTSDSEDSADTEDPSPTTGTINGYEWVDLGLSVKWATCNVGASSPSDYGDYFAWGETETKSSYSRDNSVTNGKRMGNIAGDPEYDAATANWGDSWRLPTDDEIDELINQCEWEWTTLIDHIGYKVTGPNGNSIFLPAAGWRSGTALGYAGEIGGYWSATPHGESTHYAYYLGFLSGSFHRYSGDRDIGRSVRPVTE